MARGWASGAGRAALRDPFLLKLVFAAEAPVEVVEGLLRHYEAELSQRRGEYRARLRMTEIFALARSEREAELWRLAIENGLAWCEAQLAWAAAARARLRAVPPEAQGKRRKGKKNERKRGTSS